VKTGQAIRNFILFEYHSLLVEFWLRWPTLVGYIKTRQHLDALDQIMLEEGIIKVVPFDYNFLDPEFMQKYKAVLVEHKKLPKDAE
jgi:hypothetical protein